MKYLAFQPSKTWNPTSTTPSTFSPDLPIRHQTLCPQPKSPRRPPPTVGFVATSTPRAYATPPNQQSATPAADVGPTAATPLSRVWASTGWQPRHNHPASTSPLALPPVPQSRKDSGTRSKIGEGDERPGGAATNGSDPRSAGYEHKPHMLGRCYNKWTRQFTRFISPSL